MDWLSNAAELNRNGASLLDTGNTQLALEYFKGSVEILSIIAAGFKDCHEVPTGARTQAVTSQTQPPVDFLAVSYSTPAASQERNGSSLDSELENHYLFDRALNFNVTCGYLCPKLLSFYIAVAEFNMALCLQLLSRCWGERLAHNAFHVYNCCLHHLRRSGMECCGIILFAALNNKASIYYDMSNFQESRDVLALLLEAINSCRKTGGLHSIEDRDLEGFLFNVMLLKGACIAPAA